MEITKKQNKTRSAATGNGDGSPYAARWFRQVKPKKLTSNFVVGWYSGSRLPIAAFAVRHLDLGLFFSQILHRFCGANYAGRKLLPVCGRHLGNGRLATDVYLLTYGQPASVIKSRCRCQQRHHKSTIYMCSVLPSIKLLDEMAANGRSFNALLDWTNPGRHLDYL